MKDEGRYERLAATLRREQVALEQALAQDATYRARRGAVEADRYITFCRGAVKRAQTNLRKAIEANPAHDPSMETVIIPTADGLQKVRGRS